MVQVVDRDSFQRTYYIYSLQIHFPLLHTRTRRGRMSFHAKVLVSRVLCWLRPAWPSEARRAHMILGQGPMLS